LVKLRSENKEANEKLSFLGESTNKLIEQVTTKDKLIKQMSLNEEATEHQADKRVETIRLEYDKEVETLTKQNEQLAHILQNLEIQIKRLGKENKALEEKVKEQEKCDVLEQELLKAKDKLVKSEADNTSIRGINTDLRKQNEKLLESIAFEKQQHEKVKAEVFSI
jgi:hypothetical protein